MPASNTVNRLAVDKRLGHQRPLLVLAPAPPRLTQNNLHSASASDQSKRPIARLGAALDPAPCGISLSSIEAVM